MQKKFLGMIIVLFMLFSLAACNSKENGNNDPDPSDAPAETVSKEVKPTGNVVEVTVNARNFEFDVKEIKAKVGDTVKIHFVNVDGGHGFGLDEYKVKAVDGDTVEFMVTEKGEFPYYCSIMCGHGHDLMEGTLFVQ